MIGVGCRGVHPPWGHDAFPPCFRFPLFSEYFQTVENFRNFTKFYLFQKNFSIFIRQNFWWSFFLVIDHKFRISPYFPCFGPFPPVSRKLLFPLPTLTNFPPCFRKIHLLFTYFLCISFPPTLTMMHFCITQCTYAARPFAIKFHG